MVEMTDDKTENIARPIVKGLFGIYPIESVKIVYNALFSIGTVHTVTLSQLTNT